MDGHETHAEPNVIPLHSNCPQDTLIRRHASEIDAAHAKVRDLAAELAMLQALVQQGTDRINRLEDQVSRTTTAVETIRGELEAIRALQNSALTQIRTLEDLMRDTNRILQTHVTEAQVSSSQEHVERLGEIERMTVRMVKITGLLSALVLVVSMVWKSVFGPGLGAFVRDIMQ